MFDHLPAETKNLIIALLGPALGGIVSTILVAPASWGNAFLRLCVSISMGAIFAPALPKIYGFGIIAGPSFEMVMARGAFTGLVIYFVLNIVLSILSRNDWAIALLEELVKNRGKK